MTRIPFMVVSDGPQEPSGLGRIARDLCGYISRSDLPLNLLHVGGPVLPPWLEYSWMPLTEADREEDWGAHYVRQLWGCLWGDRPGILWVIWDPGRLAAFAQVQGPWQLWSYPAIDAPNRNESVGGPAGQALDRADRVLAYGRWASSIVVNRLQRAVPYLPHGIDLDDQPATAAEEAWVTAQFGPYRGSQSLVVGCVATNQPRKDLGLYCQTLAELQARGYKVYGWLHTDVLVKAWSVPQLIDDCGLAKKLSITHNLTDRQLTLLYRACDVTIAPGLGEGFGYPIVESLAAGTPVVHGDFAGGRELVPKKEWRFPVREVRLDGIYAQQRPLFRAEDVANAIERVLEWRRQVGPETAVAYCKGSVAHLQWAHLWPRWQQWIKVGLEG